MASPTDLPSGTAPPDDLDLLLGAAIETAARQLADSGEYYPFAIAVDTGGDMVAPEISPSSDRPGPEEVVELLVAALRDAAEGLRATVVVTDVHLADQGRDAIKADLEKPEGDPVSVVIPYDEGPVLDEPFGVPGVRRVFSR